MTNQEKKDFLRRYRDADRRFTALCDELVSWRSKAAKITPSLSGLPGGSTENTLQMAVERIVELEGKIDQEIAQLMRIRTEVMEAIATVQDAKLRALLEYRYIHVDTWERIAERMGYSWRQIMRLHRLALAAVKMS